MIVNAIDTDELTDFNLFMTLEEGDIRCENDIILDKVIRADRDEMLEDLLERIEFPPLHESESKLFKLCMSKSIKYGSQKVIESLEKAKEAEGRINFNYSFENLINAVKANNIFLASKLIIKYSRTLHRDHNSLIYVALCSAKLHNNSFILTKLKEQNLSPVMILSEIMTGYEFTLIDEITNTISEIESYHVEDGEAVEDGEPVEA